MRRGDMECQNCGHNEDDHKWSDERSSTICTGDGLFDDGSPQCDCDLFEEEEEDEEDEE
jgi:hypothetical protein